MSFSAKIRDIINESNKVVAKTERVIEMTLNDMLNQSTKVTLEGSVELTTLCGKLATELIRTMNDSVEEYGERISVVYSSGEEMDKLLEELLDYEAATEQAKFLLDIDEETISNILRSQQSKRSRLRSKAPTLDSFRSLLTASIAENVIRKLTGRTKHSTSRRAHASVDYTPAELEMFAEDQNALRRAIRNVQSKKSIYKGKAGFSEQDEYWIQLLKVEQQLKDLRVDNHVDGTKKALIELLGDVNIEELKEKGSAELLQSIQALVQGNDVG